jgi:hypothetical protein
MTLFGKIIAGIGTTGAAVAAIVAVYSWGESLKPAPVTKQEVKEIVKEEVGAQVAPLKIQMDTFMFHYSIDKKAAMTISEKIIHNIINIDTAMDRHLRLTKRFQERFQFSQDQREPLSEKKNPGPIQSWPIQQSISTHLYTSQ